MMSLLSVDDDNIFGLFVLMDVAALVDAVVVVVVVSVVVVVVVVVVMVVVGVVFAVVLVNCVVEATGIKSTSVHESA